MVPSIPMADFAASIIGIVSAGTKVALVLSQVASDIGSAGREARTIATEIRCLCSILKTLHDAIEKVQLSPYYAHCVEVIRDMTDASLEMYSDILTITGSLQAMAKTQEGKFKLRARIQWAAFDKPKLTMLRAALEAYKSNLALMLGTLGIAEKVSRRTELTPRQDSIAEDEQDSYLLESLELEQQASLINLREAERTLLEEEEEEVENKEEEEEYPYTEVTQAASTGTQTDARGGLSGENAGNMTNDGFIHHLRDAIESLRSTHTTFYSVESTFNRLSRYSERLSGLLVEDQNRISQRWSQSIPEVRLSHTLETQGSSMSASLEYPQTRGFIYSNGNISRNPIDNYSGQRLICPPRNAESYCFSCYDLVGFSTQDKSPFILPVLFWKYNLGEEDAWVRYNVWILNLPNGSKRQVSPQEPLLPFFQQWADCGSSCALLLKKSRGPLSPRLLTEASAAIIKPPQSIDTSPSGNTFKSFPVSMDDPCYKVLPIALKQYNINDDWRQYSLYITYGNQERCLGLEERPLVLFKQLDKEGRKPMFVLRKQQSISNVFESRPAQGSLQLPGGVL